jgi:hypothetical protein
MQATNNVKKNSEKLHEILSSMNYDINQSQCFAVVNEMNKSRPSEGETKIKGSCLDVISKLDGYEDWSTYKGDISVHLNRAEQFVDEMMEGDAESSYSKFTQRFEEKYLVNFTEKKFLRDVREIREDFGDYINRQFLGCLAGGTDPEAIAKYPHELRYVWRFVFEKNEVIGVACIYCRDGNYYVSGFNYR